MIFFRTFAVSRKNVVEEMEKRKKEKENHTAQCGQYEDGAGAGNKCWARKVEGRPGRQLVVARSNSPDILKYARTDTTGFLNAIEIYFQSL